MDESDFIVTPEKAQMIIDWVDSWIESSLRNDVSLEMAPFKEGILNLFMAKVGIIPADGIDIFKLLVKEAKDSGHAKGWLVRETNFEAEAIRFGDRGQFAEKNLKEWIDGHPEYTDLFLDIYNARIKRVIPVSRGGQ